MERDPIYNAPIPPEIREQFPAGVFKMVAQSGRAQASPPTSIEISERRMWRFWLVLAAFLIITIGVLAPLREGSGEVSPDVRTPVPARARADSVRQDGGSDVGVVTSPES